MRCAVPVAPLRLWPSDRAEQVTQVLLHEPLRVDDLRGRWALVSTVYEYSGWVRLEHIEEGAGVLPPPEGVEPLELARGYLGAPYEWGGLTAAGIDCSGLVHVAYRRAGLIVARDAWQQEAAGLPVPSAECRPGDLVTYGLPEKVTDHVAFWLGNGRILHSTARDGLGVVEEPEPPELVARRRAVVRLGPPAAQSRDPA
jgi:gamma-D-glutamyl-L-lysine dipeptidyl-peptidase